MTKIIAFAGKKQSGKNSAANFVVGYQMKNKLKLVDEFDIDDNGNLIVSALFNISTDINKPEEIGGYGVVDFIRYKFDNQFKNWYDENVVKEVQLYALADSLKDICSYLFKLSPQQVYGTNDDKNTETKIDWKNMCSFLPPRVVKKLKENGQYDRKMTSRELLQYFGTEVCRKLYDNCWIDIVLDKIEYESPNIALITDCRFPNEVEAIKKRDGIVIKLTKTIEEDGHGSEASIDKIDDSMFDAIIDNQNMTIREKNQEILDKLYSWRIID